MATARISLSGRVSDPAYPAWIARHAAKLGLRILATDSARNRIDVTASGPEELLHALALAASLGPESVLVERVAFGLDGAAGKGP